jgi:tetratricopeptide (TPR) repeat protein
MRGPEGSPGLLALRLREYAAFLASQGEWGNARAAYEEGIALTRAPPDGTRQNPDFLRAALEAYSDALSARGDFVAARPLVDEALQISRQMLDASPGNLFTAADMPRRVRYQAAVMIGQGEFAAARAACERAAAMIKYLIEMEPEKGFLVLDHARALSCSGDVFLAQRDLQNARAAYERSRDMLRGLMERPLPSMPTHVPFYRAFVEFSFAEVALAQGRKEEAIASLQLARDVFKTYADRNGDTEAALYQWKLLGAEFRLAQAREDAPGLARAMSRLRELDGSGFTPLNEPWVHELRTLAHRQAR